MSNINNIHTANTVKITKFRDYWGTWINLKPTDYGVTILEPVEPAGPVTPLNIEGKVNAPDNI